MAGATGQGPLLVDRVALITGGGGAVGAASAELLAVHGAAVTVVDVVGERVTEAVAAVERAGGRALGVVADLTEPGTVEDAVARTEAAFGPVDVLVNAIGEHHAMAAPFEDSDESGWDALYRVNLLPVLRACHAVVAGMKARGWGRIVNFSSVEGIRAMPLAAPYTAFKAAIDGFTKSLAVEVAGAGVRVNAIAVDKTRAHQTGFYDLGDEYDRHVGVWIPAGRYAEGEDVAKVVLFLASDLSDWIVGETIAADGGTLRAGGWYRTPAKLTNSPLLVQWFEDDPSINAARPRQVQ
jgi:NAD(P)-dependent dehydrogenase (short-subunit alcohol dehydrogenase family)